MRAIFDNLEPGMLMILPQGSTCTIAPAVVYVLTVAADYGDGYGVVGVFRSITDAWAEARKLVFMDDGKTREPPTEAGSWCVPGREYRVEEQGVR